MQIAAATHIVGMPTNIDFMRTILNHEDFVAANVYTGFIDDRQDALLSKSVPKKKEICKISTKCVHPEACRRCRRR